MTNNYYQKNIEKFQKESFEKYQSLSEEEQNKKRKYACEQYRNLFTEIKEKKCQYHREHIRIFLRN